MVLTTDHTNRLIRMIITTRQGRGITMEKVKELVSLTDDVMLIGATAATLSSLKYIGTGDYTGQLAESVIIQPGDYGLRICPTESTPTTTTGLYIPAWNMFQLNNPLDIKRCKMRSASAQTCIVNLNLSFTATPYSK
jgi:hypothetical protein